jgi:hypothetical protein
LGRGEIVTLISRRGEVRTAIEQIVLDAGKIGRGIVAEHGNREADRAVRLVHRSDRRNARRVFRTARAIDEAGRTVVAGFRVNLVEFDHFAAISSTATTTTASAWYLMRLNIISFWRFCIRPARSSSASSSILVLCMKATIPRTRLMTTKIDRMTMRMMRNVFMVHQIGAATA